VRRIGMGCKEILKQALQLKPEERFTVVEGLLKSLDEPDKNLDDIWAEEAEKRLKAYREGRLQGIPMEEIFKDET
jgi:putative addiction module component (TIGR02574 family)